MAKLKMLLLQTRIVEIDKSGDGLGKKKIAVGPLLAHFGEHNISLARSSSVSNDAITWLLTGTSSLPFPTVHFLSYVVVLFFVTVPLNVYVNMLNKFKVSNFLAYFSFLSFYKAVPLSILFCNTAFTLICNA